MENQVTCMYVALCLCLLMIVSPSFAGIRGRFDLERKGLEEEPIKLFPTDMSLYDQNGDDVVDYEEFSFAVMKVLELPLMNPTELRNVFERADADGDEEIDGTEINRLLLGVSMEKKNASKRTTIIHTESGDSRGSRCTVVCTERNRGGWSLTIITPECVIHCS